MMLLLLASEAMASHGGLHRSQPSRPPGNPDSGIVTGRGNQVTHGNRPDDVGHLQAPLVSPSLIQQA